MDFGCEKQQQVDRKRKRKRCDVNLLGLGEYSLVLRTSCRLRSSVVVE